MTFINKYSAYCLLGQQSKNFRFHNNLFLWEVQEKKHFTIWSDNLEEYDLEFLKIWNSNFHYVSEKNINILKSLFKIDKIKLKSSITKIDELNFVGKKNATFRNYLNRYKNFEILDNFKNISDVKVMINEWSESSGDKYFRDFSGKNYHYFANNYHITNDNIFVYNGNELVAFGVASPVENGSCSYIIGKSLCLKYKGLSEFTDLKLYDKLLNKYGKFSINLGQAKGGLEFYKGKFPNTTFEVHFDGSLRNDI